MGRPLWKTKAGNLGTIQEQTFYQLQMEATDPDGGDVNYAIVAGSLPPGLVMYENGSILGNPKEIYYLRGVPQDVSEDVTSTFCCRATSTSTNQITDRTFSITVTGEDPPVITTPDQELARVLDGRFFSYQLEAIDLDNEPISWAITSGTLPGGLTLDPNTGIISGYVQPEVNLKVEGTVGWSSEGRWDEFPWQFGSSFLSKSYQFEVQATDGKSYDGARYTIYVYAQGNMRADNGDITIDDDEFLTADLEVNHTPVLLTKPSDLGTYAADNYFAYRFEAKDFDDDIVNFTLLVAASTGWDPLYDLSFAYPVMPSGHGHNPALIGQAGSFDAGLFDAGEFTLPPGLTLNTETGWLYGQIPSQVLGQIDYKFAIRVYKRDYPQYISGLTYFTMTLVNDLRYFISWDTDSDLGEIKTGAISEKFVSASNGLGRSLIYTLVYDDDVDTKLPQGLSLTSDGLIVGRPSFELTSYDKGATTFDVNVRQLGVLIGQTTFDREYDFKVKASDSNGELVAYRTFKITITPDSYGPYESLYLKSMPGLEDKEIVRQAISNTDVIPNEILYRNSDPYFGRSRDLRMLLLSGIKASTMTQYVQAMATNHYRKKFRFSDFKVARALNDDQSVAYEVVYAEILDDQMESNTVSAPNVIDFTGRIKRDTTVDTSKMIVDNNLDSLDGKSDKVVYPSSLINMRNKMIADLSLSVLEPLPRWMTSKQEDGRIIGWVPAVVVAYVKPGEGARVAFNIERNNSNINLVSFEVDRYILDNNLSKYYDATNGTYNESEVTTFDTEVSPFEEPVGIVDFAVSSPFNQIDGLTEEFVRNTLGGLDGINDTYEGKKIIFALQENYPGYILDENQGWTRNLNSWDDAGWEDTVNGWDHYEVIPGYIDSLDNSTENQRSGIWLITKDSGDLLRLELVTTVDAGQTVQVKYGVRYGGFIMRYGPLPKFDAGETVPRYEKYQPVDVAIATTFDNNMTRFINNISIYQDPDEDDKYLAFPRENIWA